MKRGYKHARFLITLSPRPPIKMKERTNHARPLTPECVLFVQGIKALSCCGWEREESLELLSEPRIDIIVSEKRPPQPTTASNEVKLRTGLSAAALRANRVCRTYLILSYLQQFSLRWRGSLLCGELLRHEYECTGQTGKGGTPPPRALSGDSRHRHVTHCALHSVYRACVSHTWGEKEWIMWEKVFQGKTRGKGKGGGEERGFLSPKCRRNDHTGRLSKADTGVLLLFL